MGEEIKPKSYEEMQQERIENEKKKLDRLEQVRQQTMQRLKTDTAIQKYFEKYNAGSVESFIQSYGQLKSLYMEYGEKFGEYTEQHNVAFFEDAVECLKQIQIKKLFDLRCEWGANKVRLPGIEVSWDFLPMYQDIFNCPLISPISPEEFELFMLYAASENFVREEQMEWLDFADMRTDTEGDNPELPEWFYFHNIHTGANRFLVLPDIRAEKEIFYRKLSSEEFHAEIEKKYQSGELPRPKPVDNRPWLHSYYYDVIKDFVKQFEDENANKKFNGYQEFYSTLSRDPEGNDDYLNEQAEERIHDLLKIHPVPAIETNADWRVALLNVWKKYETEQTIAALSVAYEDYLFRIQNNIVFEKSDQINFNIELAKNVKEQVLRGRELNGEPRDFNF